MSPGCFSERRNDRSPPLGRLLASGPRPETPAGDNAVCPPASLTDTLTLVWRVSALS